MIENQLVGQIINLDKLTYAGNSANLSRIEEDRSYHFIKGDISNQEVVRSILEKYKPNVIVNFAAESYVDRSIDGPVEFIQTNVVGTLNLLHESHKWLKNMNSVVEESFKFIHISTDEVYGSLGKTGKFQETTPYDPSSPYSVSKASSDHLARAWFRHMRFSSNCDELF